MVHPQGNVYHLASTLVAAMLYALRSGGGGGADDDEAAAGPAAASAPAAPGGDRAAAVPPPSFGLRGLAGAAGEHGSWLLAQWLSSRRGFLHRRALEVGGGLAHPCSSASPSPCVAHACT